MSKKVQVQIEDRIYNATLDKISEGLKTGVEFTIVGEKYQFWCKGIRKVMLDEEFTVRGTKLRIVYYNGACDIVQYDKLVGEQRPYTGFPKLTWWAILQLLCCIALPVLTLGGLLPIAGCLLGLVWIYDTHKSPFLTPLMKLRDSMLVLGFIYIVTWFVCGKFALFSALF